MSDSCSARSRGIISPEHLQSCSDCGAVNHCALFPIISNEPDNPSVNNEMNTGLLWTAVLSSSANKVMIHREEQ